MQTNDSIVTRLEEDPKKVNPADTKSVSSSSADETMTATEHADEDEERLSNERHKEANPKENENQNETKKLIPKPVRPHSNPSISSKSLMDKIFHNDKTDSLKSFKIPKQSRKELNNSTGMTGAMLNADSSKFEATISRSVKHNRNLSDDLEFSSSSFNQVESKSYSNYYHPKKKYMMENSNTRSNEDLNGYKNKNENCDLYRTGSIFSTQSSSGSSQTQNELNTQD